MHELTVADVDAHVGGTLAGVAVVEEHQITGLQLRVGNGSAVVHLSGGGAVHGVALLAAHVADKAGAVKAAGAAAAVDVGITHKLEGVLGDGAAVGGSGHHAGVHDGHVIGAHIAVLGLIPTADAAHSVHDLHDSAGGEGTGGGVLGAGAGADVQGTHHDLTVDLFLLDLQVVAGEVAGHSVVGDLVPAAVSGGADHVNLGAVGQGGQNGGIGTGAAAEIQTGVTDNGADAGSQGGSRHSGQSQNDGGDLSGKGLGQVHRKAPPFSFSYRW